MTFGSLASVFSTVLIFLRNNSEHQQPAAKEAFHNFQVQAYTSKTASARSGSFEISSEKSHVRSGRTITPSFVARCVAVDIQFETERSHNNDRAMLHNFGSGHVGNEWSISLVLDGQRRICIETNPMDHVYSGSQCSIDSTGAVENGSDIWQCEKY